MLETIIGLIIALIILTAIIPLAALGFVSAGVAIAMIVTVAVVLIGAVIGTLANAVEGRAS